MTRSPMLLDARPRRRGSLVLEPPRAFEKAPKAAVVRGERTDPRAERLARPVVRGAGRREAIAGARRTGGARRMVREGIATEERKRARIAVQQLPDQVERPRILVRRRHRGEPHLPVEPRLV